jgi:hypothetical protein
MEAIYLQIKDSSEVVWVSAYTEYNEHFGIHRDPDVAKVWAVTHVPTGCRIFEGRTRAHCVCKLRVMLRRAMMHNDDWSTDPRKWPEYVRIYYRETLDQIDNDDALRLDCKCYNIHFSC